MTAAHDRQDRPQQQWPRLGWIIARDEVASIKKKKDIPGCPGHLLGVFGPEEFGP